MTLTHLLTHCTLDSAAMVEEGYDSWVPDDDVLIQCKSARGIWYTATYIQLCDPKISWQEPGNRVLIVQLEGLPDDPINTTALHDLPMRIFRTELLTFS